MDHIYILQSTHTQSYQSIKKYRLKYSFGAYNTIYSQIMRHDTTQQNKL